MRFEWDPEKAALNERLHDLVRIISAWWATKAEQDLYAEYMEHLR